MSTLKVDAIRHNSATSDAITTAADGTCSAKLTSVGGGQLSNRNLIINGGMNINQYGSSSSTSTGKKIFDRWHPNWNAGTITQSKETITSGGAYDAGHRSCLRLTNTSAAGSAAGTYVEVYYKWEAQDIARSGWNYKSASSYITLSFWLRSSVAQTYSCTIQTRDGTNYLHPFTAVISSANTWTKITKTFAGNSNLTINDDNGDGLMMWVNPMQGSNFHNNSWNTNGWFAQSGNSMFAGTTDTTWGTTAGATWDVTGFQLEVGDTATSFEHRSYGDELLRCMRYYQQVTGDDRGIRGGGSTGSFKNAVMGLYNGESDVRVIYYHRVPMRDSPTFSVLGAMSDFDLEPYDRAPSSIALNRTSPYQTSLYIVDSGTATKGHGCQLTLDTAAAGLAFSAEL